MRRCCCCLVQQRQRWRVAVLYLFAAEAEVTWGGFDALDGEMSDALALGALWGPPLEEGQSWCCIGAGCTVGVTLGGRVMLMSLSSLTLDAAKDRMMKICLTALAGN